MNLAVSEGGWSLSGHDPFTNPPGKDLVTIVQEAQWAPRLVRMGAENLAALGLEL